MDKSDTKMIERSRGYGFDAAHESPLESVGHSTVESSPVCVETKERGSSARKSRSLETDKKRKRSSKRVKSFLHWCAALLIL
jgi:hypothetical protein